MNVRALTPLPTVRWAAHAVRILDQRSLPRRESFLDLRDPAALIRAIRALAVRGAPALGIAGAYGVALAAAAALRRGKDPGRAARRAGPRIAAARPTAVNLSLGVRLALERLGAAEAEGLAGEALVESLKGTGDMMLEADLAASRAMARNGAPLIPEGRPVLTHCNTGGLATGGLGTALAVILAAAAEGRVPEVLVDETRPLMQGGRLTLWELKRAGIPSRLICDGAAAHALRHLGAGCVLVGADRVAANGDTANKVGTYGLALAARSAETPFYVVAPWTSFDPSVPDGGAIPIEERGEEEILRASGWTAGDGARAYNPAFDVTPAGLITAWITDRGVLRPPFRVGPEAMG